MRFTIAAPKPEAVEATSQQLPKRTSVRNPF